MWSAEQMQLFFDMLCLVFNLLLTTDSIVVLLKKGMESCVCGASAAYMLGQSGLSCLVKAVYDLPVRFRRSVHAKRQSLWKSKTFAAVCRLNKSHPHRPLALEAMQAAFENPDIAQG